MYTFLKSKRFSWTGALNPVVADFGFVAAMSSSVGSTTVVTAIGAALLALSRGYHAPEVVDGSLGHRVTHIYSYSVFEMRCQVVVN